MSKESKRMSPARALGKGLLFILPFFVLNLIVSLRIEPIYSVLGSFEVIRNNPFLPLFLLLLFPIGAFIMIRPMLQKSVDGKKRIYLLNVILAAIILIIFLVLFIALGEDIYRCDVLKIPNCD